MRKLIRRVIICFLIAAIFWCGTLIADRNLLNEELIRLHIVANSDSEEDQNIKLRVRDVVVSSLSSAMQDIGDVEAAKTYLQDNLPKITKLVNGLLKEIGFDGEAVVTLCKEAFDTRYYDTFTLPAGVYDALRITIGEGEGKNWWCVVFPTLCVPATSEGFSDVAAVAGFSDALSGSLTGETGYEIRFYFLDVLGKLENFLYME